MALKLISIELPPSWQVWLKSTFSIAVGGAVGALGDIYVQAVDLSKGKIELNKIDFHRLAAIAVGGAVLSLYKRWQPPPNQPAVQSTTVEPPK
jgi:hypothetical protein